MHVGRQSGTKMFWGHTDTSQSEKSIQLILTPTEVNKYVYFKDLSKQMVYENYLIRFFRASQTSAHLNLFLHFLFRYISTVNLQIEVTKYFFLYLDNFEQSLSESVGIYITSTPSRKSPILPTLFGSTKMKSHIVTLVRKG